MNWRIKTSKLIFKPSENVWLEPVTGYTDISRDAMGGDRQTIWYMYIRTYEYKCGADSKENRSNVKQQKLSLWKLYDWSS